MLWDLLEVPQVLQVSCYVIDARKPKNSLRIAAPSPAVCRPTVPNTAAICTAEYSATEFDHPHTFRKNLIYENNDAGIIAGTDLQPLYTKRRLALVMCQAELITFGCKIKTWDARQRHTWPHIDTSSSLMRSEEHHQVEAPAVATVVPTPALLV